MSLLVRSSKPSIHDSKFRPVRPPLQLAGETSNSGNGSTNGFVVAKKQSQKDQEDADNEKQQEAMSTLIQTWIDSLQLITVITTFFVATEASFLVISIPSRTDPALSIAGRVSNIGLMSALVIHCHSAVISFVGAFCLIRYKLDFVQKNEEKIEKQLFNSTSKFDSDTVRGRVSPPSGDQITWSTNPHLVQVGPFQGPPPSLLLARCHLLCVFLSFIGLVLAIMGVVSMAWDRLPLVVSIFPIIWSGLSLFAALMIIIIPPTKSSHMYYGLTS